MARADINLYLMLKTNTIKRRNGEVCQILDLTFNALLGFATKLNWFHLYQKVCVCFVSLFSCGLRNLLDTEVTLGTTGAVRCDVHSYAQQKTQLWIETRFVLQRRVFFFFFCAVALGKSFHSLICAKGSSSAELSVIPGTCLHQVLSHILDATIWSFGLIVESLTLMVTRFLFSRLSRCDTADPETQIASGSWQ